MKLKRLIGITLLMAAICILMGACHSHKADSAFLKVSQFYDQAHQAQDSANYAQAMELYKKCVTECSAQKYEKDDSVKTILPKAMVQLVNTYQSASMPKECIAYFDSLKIEVSLKPTTPLNATLKQTYKRDVYVLLAYAMSRTEAEKEAALVMDSALAMPLSYPTPERKFRDYAYAAGVYYCVPACQAKVLKYGRLALDEIKLCQNKSGAQWLVALMAKLYQDKGEVGKAIAMCREGYQLAEICQDTLGMANSKKELANYLYQWRLYDDANKYISEAITLIEHTSNSNPMVATVAYTIKAKTLMQKGKKTEALTYLQKAKKVSEGLPYNSGISDIDLLMGKMLIADTVPTHYAQGMKLLTQVASEATNGLRAQAFYEMAKANIQKKNDGYGEVCLDSMYAILHTTSTPVVIEGAYDFALNHYLKKGNQDKIVRYSAAINQQKMAEEKAGSIKTAAKSMARFEMDKQEAEMEQKLQEMEWRKVLEIIGIILTVIILGALVGFFFYKRKKMRQKHVLTEQKLSKARVELAKTSKEKDKVESKLKRMEERQVEKAIAGGVSLQQLLDMKADKNFKDYFNKAYPYFLINIRKKMAHFTPKEELYSMLIALHCSNEELASTFGVTRKSIIMAKYRIRKKLDLAEGEALEEYLANELTAKAE